MINPDFYFNSLYPFQDRVCQVIRPVEAGIFPADLARLLCSASEADWKAVRWIKPPSVEVFLSQLNDLGEGLLLIR